MIGFYRSIVAFLGGSKLFVLATLGPHRQVQSHRSRKEIRQIPSGKVFVTLTVSHLKVHIGPVLFLGKFDLHLRLSNLCLSQPQPRIMG